MKRIIALAVILMQLFVGFGAAQSHAKGRDTSPTRVQFSKLKDYLHNSYQRRPGATLIVEDVPPVEEITRHEVLNGLYSVDIQGQSFIARPALVKGLRWHLKDETAYLRITCTLVEIRAELDVLRAPFAFKVEGVDSNGKIIWTELGRTPTRIKYRA